MKNLYLCGIFIIVMLLLLAIVNINIVNTMSNNILAGYWKADTNFLEKNDISFFTFAISPCKASSCNIYMVMKDTKNATILNENNKMKITNSTWNPFSWQKKYNITFEHPVGEDDDEDDVVMPIKLKMIFEPISGFLTLYDKDTVYAEMYKDNELSDIEV